MMSKATYWAVVNAKHKAMRVVTFTDGEAWAAEKVMRKFASLLADLFQEDNPEFKRDLFLNCMQHNTPRLSDATRRAHMEDKP